MDVGLRTVALRSDSALELPHCSLLAIATPALHRVVSWLEQDQSSRELPTDSCRVGPERGVLRFSQGTGGQAHGLGLNVDSVWCKGGPCQLALESSFRSLLWRQDVDETLDSSV